MQIKYFGENNKGEVIVTRENDDITHPELNILLEKDMAEFPSAIYWRIEIARPDPEVVKLKKEIVSLLDRSITRLPTY